MTGVLSIPSPATGVWELGPVPLRGYALSIVLGVVLAIWLSERRWAARGGRRGEISDIALWAVPFGLVGGRLYHVVTDWRLYFGEGRNPVSALYVWNGGLGIWGAIALGALGAYIGARRAGIRVAPVMDVLAPGVLLGQAVGRWGNWFNQELYGRPTDLPWGLEIDPANWPSGQEFEPGTTFHPTFLYESLWSLAGVALLLLLDRRLAMGRGRLVAAYVMVYTAGRGWIEMLRIDDVQMNDVGGLRLNVWTSIVVFALAAAYLLWTRSHPPADPEPIYTDARLGRDAAETDAGPPESTTTTGTTPTTPGTPTTTGAEGEDAAAERRTD
ncbi:prolipoprotein diacylglyceryl transferase [Nocardioides sp. CFH 31398]|uniref:prolipoprotein diacylglyceryl transferase n=1 Tax=Nocardioides sp. CFH 31398 TaxID=2919579 RepID=UPI001F06057B|nr:prolipoprotein diacylglyceryl transferase [Nocardioides sp. CFH 31398]MCH1868312.1 prolipoprotein diacylglyceryl transferase [Nocardioides sp. CFH 31398]